MEDKQVQETASTEATPLSTKKTKIVGGKKLKPKKEDVKEEPIAEAVKEPVKQKSTREIMEDYLNMPEVCNNLRAWGRSFAERFHNNWFTVEQVIKKTPCKVISNAQGILDYLILKGWAHRMDHQGVMKYKITFTPQEKIHQLRLEVERLDLQKEALLTEITKLEGTSANVEEK